MSLQSFLSGLKVVEAKLKQVDYVDLVQKAYTAVEVVEAVNSVTGNSAKVSNATTKAKVVLNVANKVANSVK